MLCLKLTSFAVAFLTPCLHILGCKFSECFLVVGCVNCSLLVKIFILDLIDSVKDSFPSKDYKKEEDPHYFVSTKTGRGPLQDDWLAKYKDDSTDPVMCAYKLIRVEFKYWGMQVKLNPFFLYV